MTAKALMMLLTAFALSATSAAGADVFSGTWKINMEKSQFSPGPILRPTGPNFTKVEDIENGLKFLSDGVDGKGRPTHGEYAVTFDGKDFPYTQLVDGKTDPDSAPTTVSLKKVGDHELALTFKSSGRVVLISRLVVSTDGKTAIATSTGFNSDGTTSASSVFYDKQ